MDAQQNFFGSQCLQKAEILKLSMPNIIVHCTLISYLKEEHQMSYSTGKTTFAKALQKFGNGKLRSTLMNLANSKTYARRIQEKGVRKICHTSEGFPVNSTIRKQNYCLGRSTVNSVSSCLNRITFLETVYTKQFFLLTNLTIQYCGAKAFTWYLEQNSRYSLSSHHSFAGENAF